MTLDEAIKHCTEKACGDCSECAEEHQQLADWLRIADYYGEKQIPLVIEEMAELTQALTKYIRITQGGQPVRKTIGEVRENIKEELSDVIVMLIQLQHLFYIDEVAINKIAVEKLDRTMKLMEGNK